MDNELKQRMNIAFAVALLIVGQIRVPAFADHYVRATARNSVNTNRNVNVNRNTNVNVNRNVDVNVRGGGYYGGCCYHEYHPVATAAAVVATAAIVGSIVASIPPSCTTVMVNGFAYRQCGNTWYQPQISGSSTTYVVVNPPH
jgi:hypothetical protein